MSGEQIENNFQNQQIFCDIHEDEQIIAVCLKDDCELEQQRFLCLNCLLNEHSMHPQSCVKLRELTKKSNQNLSSTYNILNWPQDRAIQKIMKQVTDEKKKDEAHFVETLFNKFQEDIIKQIQVAKQEVIKIIESERQQRQTFLSNLEQKINQIIDLRPLKDIIFDQPNLIEQSVYNSLNPSPSCQLNKNDGNNNENNFVNDSQVLYESRRIDQSAFQSINQGQSLKESVHILKETIMQQFSSNENTQNKDLLISQQQVLQLSQQNSLQNNNMQVNQEQNSNEEGLVNSSSNLAQTLYLGQAKQNEENSNQSKQSILALRSKKLSELLKNDKKKKQIIEVKEYYVKNKSKLGSSLQLKNFNDEKLLVLSQIEDIPWILLKYFGFDKQKINNNNTDLQEENTLAILTGANTSNLVYSDLPLQNGQYSIKIQLQNIQTHHFLIGVVQEQYKDTLNFNNNCWIYQCLICRNQEHCKNMKRNTQNLSGKISSLITIRINFEENQLNIYDINDTLISSMFQDIDLRNNVYRFFVSSISQQTQNCQVKLVQSIKLN